MSSCFEIVKHDDASRARAGVLNTAHGVLHTPAFVPLATKATIKTLLPHEVADIGYEMVLGNTFHLFIRPGHEQIKRFGGLHQFMRWDQPIITDSGGFQVFSMGHGTIADEIKGRSQRPAGREGRVISIKEEGVWFRSYLDGSKRFIGPETSMEIQAALGSDIALVFDECTPYHVTRDYTAASTQRTHRWLERCLTWHQDHGSKDQLVYGIVQGGVYEDLRTESAQAVAASSCDGIAIGGSLGAQKEQMYEVVDWATAQLPVERPRHLLGIGDIDDLVHGVQLGIDTFDCAIPTRLARHGVALIPDPDHRWRLDLTVSRWKDSQEPILEGCSCTACQQGFTRGYIRYLLLANELTALRLLTLHNLAFVANVMQHLRQAILDESLAEVAEKILRGVMPISG